MLKADIRIEPLKHDHKNVVFLPSEFVDQAMLPGSHFYAVFGEERCVGIVGIRLTPDPDTPELFVAIDPKHGNHGYGTAAVADVLRRGFTELGVNEVYARCLPGRAAARICEKLGFLQYGKGQNEVYYVLPRDRWPG